MFTVVICPVISWGMCSAFITGPSFTNFQDCQKAVPAIVQYSKEKPAYILCKDLSKEK